MVWCWRSLRWTTSLACGCSPGPFLAVPPRTQGGHGDLQLLTGVLVRCGDSWGEHKIPPDMSKCACANSQVYFLLSEWPF